jgi:hypothetical protein
MPSSAAFAGTSAALSIVVSARRNRARLVQRRAASTDDGVSAAVATAVGTNNPATRAVRQAAPYFRVISVSRLLVGAQFRRATSPRAKRFFV